MQADPGGAVGEGALRGGWLGRCGGWAGAAEQVEGCLGPVVTASGGHLVKVPGHLADDGAAGAAGLNGAVEFTDHRYERMAVDLY